MAVVAYLTWNMNMGFTGFRRSSPNEELVFLTMTRKQAEEVIAPWMKVPPSGLYIEYYQLVEE